MRLSVLVALLLLPVPAMAANITVDAPAFVGKDGTPFVVNLCADTLGENAIWGVRGQVGNSAASKYASKIWTGSSWYGYGDRAAFNITANESGGWCGRVVLQANPNSTNWESLIAGNSSAWASIGLRKVGTASWSQWSQKQVSLLDVCDPVVDDECTQERLPSGQTGGTPGGWLLGYWEEARTMTIEVRNRTHVLSRLVSEPNGVEDGIENLPGLWKTVAPAGNWTVTAGNITRNATVFTNDSAGVGRVVDLLLWSPFEVEDTVLTGSPYLLFGFDNMENFNVFSDVTGQMLTVDFEWNITGPKNSSGKSSTDLTEEGFTGVFYPTIAGEWNVYGAITGIKSGGYNVWNIEPEYQGFDNTKLDMEITTLPDTPDCSSPVSVTINKTVFAQGEDVEFSVGGTGRLQWRIVNLVNNTILARYPTKNTTEIWQPKKSELGNYKILAGPQGCEETAYADFRIVKSGELSIKVSMENSSVAAGETAKVMVEIVNDKQTAATGTLDARVARKIGSRWSYKWLVSDGEDSIPLEVPEKSVTIWIGNWTVPTDAITGSYRASAKWVGDSTIRKYTEFNVSGLPDLGEPQLMVTSVTPVVEFGSIGIVSGRLRAGNSRLNARAVAYLYSPGWITTDIEGNTLRTNVSSSDMAVEFAVERGSNYILELPLLLKSACDGYSPGTYTGKLRIFQLSGESWVDWLESQFNTSVTGECSLENSQPGGPLVSGTVKKETQPKAGKQKTQPVEIFLSAVPEFRAGTETTYTVSVVSGLNETKPVDVYSYVFDGHQLASTGGWTANRRTLDMEPSKATSIELKNKIKTNATGDWTLRVRVTDGVSDWAESWPVQILEAGAATEEVAEKQEEAPISGGPTGGFVTESWIVQAVVSFFQGFFTWLTSAFVI